MSTPRPSEADVEALAEALRQIDAAGSVQTYERHARAILASDWLTARDAEQERRARGHARAVEIIARSRDGHMARAEAAERALADLRGEIKALADKWTGVRDYRTYYGDRAGDAAGAGGAG